MLRLLNRFRHGTAGNVAVTFGLISIPLLALGGAAIDYSRASTLRAQILAATDAATIAAIAQSSAAIAAATSMSGDGPISAGVTDAKNFFNANLKMPSDATLTALNVTVTKSSNTVTANINFTATIPMYFMKLVGINSMTISDTSTASNNLPVFIDFYLLLDNTPSMGVGATQTDIDKMVNNTPDQCAFACHDLSNPSGNYYNLAKQLGVRMRIDVLRTATQQLMDTASSTETYSNQFRMAIYTFGYDASNPGLTTIASLTSNLSSAKGQANSIDLMTVPYQNYNQDQDTDYNSVMTAMNSAITTPGSGTSSATPQKVLFFVSDGVEDANVNGTRTITTIDTSLCTTIKNRGIKIAVLYTTYLPLPTNAFYNQYVAPFQSNIGPTMQSCASPGLYFEVSPTQGIATAMTALFQKAVAQARLTQ